MTAEMDAASAGRPVRDSFNAHIIEGMMYNDAGNPEALTDPQTGGLSDGVGEWFRGPV